MRRELKAGHFAIAVGRSGEGDTIASAGLVNRVGGPWQTWLGGPVDRLIRLDGGVYEGLSGAPVADASGAVIGIATSALSRSYGIVVPASTVSRVVDALLAHGRVARAWLGIGAQTVPLPETAGAAAGEKSGLLVTSLAAGGPAERAGPPDRRHHRSRRRQRRRQPARAAPGARRPCRQEGHARRPARRRAARPAGRRRRVAGRAALLVMSTMEGTHMIRVALASPSKLVRAGLADGLRGLGGFDVVLAATTLAELVEAGFGDAEVAIVDVAEEESDLEIAAGAGPHFVLLAADADERVGEWLIDGCSVLPRRRRRRPSPARRGRRSPAWSRRSPAFAAEALRFERVGERRGAPPGFETC